MWKCVGTLALVIIVYGAVPAANTGLSTIDQTTTANATSANVTTQEAKKTSWDGVYTEEQAARGQKTYKRVCGYCHRDDLSGGGDERGAPALVDSFFRFRWREHTVADMFETIGTTMPRSAPASLSPQDYVDVISFLLQANKMPAGDTELLPDVEKLEQILITEKPPQN